MPAPLLVGYLFWLAPLLAASAVLLPTRARGLVVAALVLTAAIAVTTDGVHEQAAAYGMLRRPGFAALGVWIVAIALLLGRDLRLGSIAAVAGRAALAFALVGQAALVTWTFGEMDPFAVEPIPPAPAQALFGLVMLGAALAVGMASVCAVGPARVAIDYAAATTVAVGLLGPLYPGYDRLPAGLAGELALAGAAVLVALAFVASRERGRTYSAAGVGAALSFAFVAPVGVAAVSQEVTAWLFA